MSESIIPPGAFAAMKAGNAQPAAAEAPKGEFAPKTITRKAEAPKDVKLSNSMSQDKSGEEPPKQMTPAEKKIWKLKDGEEEFEFDATDEEAVKREIMKARGADKRFKTAAEMRKQAEQFFEMMKDKNNAGKFRADPNIGANFMELAKAAVWEEIQEQQEKDLPPEERERLAKERKFAKYEEEENRRNEEEKSKQERAKQAQFETHYEAKIIKALEIGGIPKTNDSVARMADYLEKSLEHGYDLSAEELVQEVRKDYLGDISSLLDAVSEDQLLSLIGEKNAEKLRRADLKRLKSAQSNPFPQRSHPKQPSSPAQSKRLGASEWKEDLIKGFLARH